MLYLCSWIPFFAMISLSFIVYSLDGGDIFLILIFDCQQNLTRLHHVFSHLAKHSFFITMFHWLCGYENHKLQKKFQPTSLTNFAFNLNRLSHFLVLVLLQTNLSLYCLYFYNPVQHKFSSHFLTYEWQ